MRLFPVAGAVRFSDTWGAPRAGNRSHEGADIFAERGTPVLAVDDGTARSAVESTGGNAIYLQAADRRYFYGHLDGFHGLFPRKVFAGEIIGTVGNTGNAANTPPHLHFEIHPAGGAAINPYPELAALPSISSSAPPSSSSSLRANAGGAGFLLLLLVFAFVPSGRRRRATH